MRQVEQLYADLPQSVVGFPRNREFGHLLEGLLGLTETDETTLVPYGIDTVDLIVAIAKIRTPIERVRASRHWTSATSSGYNDFQPNDLLAVLTALRTITEAFPVAAMHGEISEDAPVPFDVATLPERIHDVAMATGGQALNHVEPLINRLQVMLGDASLRPVIESAGAPRSLNG